MGRLFITRCVSLGIGLAGRGLYKINFILSIFSKTQKHETLCSIREQRHGWCESLGLQLFIVIVYPNPACSPSKSTIIIIFIPRIIIMHTIIHPAPPTATSKPIPKPRLTHGLKVPRMAPCTTSTLPTMGGGKVASRCWLMAPQVSVPTPNVSDLTQLDEVIAYRLSETQPFRSAGPRSVRNVISRDGSGRNERRL